MKYLAVILLLASSVANSAPCDSPEHHQFDFWIGDWQVKRPDGTLAGINRITREYGGCVIHERYATGKGYSGESLNIYDAAREVWHQTWVDDSGLLLTIEGRWNGKSMVLEGLAPDANGAMVKQRITWTPSTDGTLRQVWETADAKGAWTVVFDGKYTKN
ncbi:MAG TPA: hypothetical protein VFV88_13555 [Steroidobacteraceae bacterium]|jgi:hypothetical protein|nr:hypothetical protein [Steroidobacteraceae bacterium]